MHTLQYVQDGNVIFVRLFPGENLSASIIEVAKQTGIQTAVILTGVGMLKNFKLGFFKGEYIETEFSEPHELISLAGNIIKTKDEYVAHLHCALAGEDKRLVGGHLITGEIVGTGEIAILKTAHNLKREKDPDTGLKLIKIDG